MSGTEIFLISALLLAPTVNGQPCSEGPPYCIDPVKVETGPANGPRSCPPSATLQAARENTTAVIQQMFRDAPCGELGWTPVVTLDLGDQSQFCPSPWVETNSPGRSCTATNNCEGSNFSASGVTYSRVCGRAVGYAVDSPDAFANFNGASIDGPYLDGISVTYGQPRQHIWSFAAGHDQTHGVIRCPCDNSDQNSAPLAPSFVGDNYFCDGESNGALWDATGCTTSCCTFHSPPWFSVTLPAPTADDIEVRICADQPAGDEDIHLRLLELYVK